MIHKLNPSFSDLHHPHSCLFSAKPTWWNSKWGKPTLGLQGPCTLNMELLWRWLITQPHRSHHHWSPQTLSASSTTRKLIVNAFASYLAGKKKNIYIYIYIHTYTYIYMYIYMCTCSVTNSCLTLCDPTDYSLTGSSVHGISQEWVAISFSRGSSQNRNRTCIFCISKQILYCWDTREAHTHKHVCVSVCVS